MKTEEELDAEYVVEFLKFAGEKLLKLSMPPPGSIPAMWPEPDEETPTP